jgi:hypothetical protein
VPRDRDGDRGGASRTNKSAPHYGWFGRNQQPGEFLDGRRLTTAPRRRTGRGGKAYGAKD